MNSTEAPDGSASGDPRPWQDGVVALLLFSMSAAVVVWQNSRVGILWDLSVVLENSYRISLGDLPYRDFPFPFAPLTFLVQAALIKLAGRVYFHHVLYCSAVSGLASVLTWRILVNLLTGVTSARLLAFLLTAPLTILGIYSIYPHPWYDPDCTLAILLGILLFQKTERKAFPPLIAFGTGTMLVVPLFVKQNIGLAFLASAGVALATLIGVDAWRRRPVRGYLWIVAGAATALLSALLLIHLTVGLGNYQHWTVQFVVGRRMPPLRHSMLNMYGDRVLRWWAAAFLAGALLWWLNRRRTPRLALLSATLMAVPFAWTLVSLLIGRDLSDRRFDLWPLLLDLWPLLLVMSLLFAVAGVRRAQGLSLFLPYILIVAVHGAFLAHQLHSTYGLWPVLMLLIGGMIKVLAAPLKERSPWQTVPFVALASVSLLVSGWYYVSNNERLNYARVSEGQIARSKLPALAGLSTRGPWIPRLEALVRFAEREIPRNDAVLMIPGEDPFYYTTGRHPRFPVLMFDPTMNPNPPEETLELSRSRQIRWLVVKRDLQLREDPMRDEDQVVRLLRQDFKQVESFAGYDVYRRKSNIDR